MQETKAADCKYGSSLVHTDRFFLKPLSKMYVICNEHDKIKY